MSLVDDLDAVQRLGFIAKPVPAHVKANLSTAIALRPYQEQALARFLYYVEDYPQRKRPTQLLFHMATGSGKTVLMAALILDLYVRGYRDFLFIVDKTQIVEKTKANFLDPASSKYLFADGVRIADRPVIIREVSNFDDGDADSINICFTTLGTLHSRINRPRENGVTIEDFADRKIVLIADEAHHLNAETLVRPGQGELELRDSWEGTVNKIFQATIDNVMLDFTATQDFRNPLIAAKYDDKILYDFSLRQFREAGYSKDIILRTVRSDAPSRMMQAVILSEYRRRLAEANGLAIKPVILMKSRQISESKANKATFDALIAALDGDAIVKLRAKAGDPTLVSAFAYILDERGTAHADFARELQRQFAPDHLIDVNDDKDLQGRQAALNTLEDRDNGYRVVFAVDKLNEGWDVLNLFDIVRLYDAGTSGTSNAEKQLIGRGARYCPFIASERPEAARAQRKYDDDLTSPLRILEQLHYHCAHDPDYLREIKAKLVESGAMAADEREATLKLKESFRLSDFFKEGVVWSNRLIKNDRAGMNALSDYRAPSLVRYPQFATGEVTEGIAFGGPATSTGAQPIVTKRCTLLDLGLPVVRHAINGLAFYRFDALRRHFPQLSGMATFIESPQFLGGVSVELQGPDQRLDALSVSDRLGIASFALRAVETAIRQRSLDKTGSKEFYPSTISALFGDEKTIKLPVDGERGKSWRDSPILRDLQLDANEWFVFEDSWGTSEEKHFIAWINARADEIRARFEEFYLIRNERVVALFAFEDGERMEPDFLLFLTQRSDGKRIVLQLFIESKGIHLEQTDTWKQRLLASVAAEASVPLFQGTQYRVFGLPFFNDEAGRRIAFEGVFDAIV